MPLKDKEAAKKYHREYHKKWYQDNKAAQIKKQKRLRHERKQWLTEYKLEKGCSKCGFNDHSVALDFHHIKGKKEANLSVMANLYGLDKIKKEVRKCTVLCKNCHAIEHAQ